LYLCTQINKKHKKMARYRKQKEESLFEEELTIWALSELGNPLEDLEKLIDFEMFRPQLEDALQNKDCKTAAGRPPIDVVLIFKVLFLQRYYGLGDHQIEYQITDRVSFRKFLGINTLPLQSIAISSYLWRNFTRISLFSLLKGQLGMNCCLR